MQVLVKKNNFLRITTLEAGWQMVFFLAEALKVKKSMELLVLVENTWGTLIFKIYFFTLKVPVLL